MRRLVGLAVSVAVVFSACAGGGSGGQGPDATQPSVNSPPGSGPLQPEVSDLALSSDDGAGLRLQQHVEAGLIDALAAQGVMLDPAEFRGADAAFIADAENLRAGIEAEVSAILPSDEADDGVVEEGDSPPTTVAGFRANPSAPRSLPAQTTQEGFDGVLKFASIFMLLLVKHNGPGDSGPSDISMSEGWKMTREQRGSRITVTAKLFSVEPMSAGSVGLDFEIRVSYDACPDEAGESGLETFMRYELSIDVPGTGVVSSELEFTATGAALVGDDAEIVEMAMDIDASQASRTTATDGTQSGASFIEGSWAMADRSIAGQGVSVDADSLAIGRHSSEATTDDYGAMATRATDFASWFSSLVMVNAQEGWSEGQCIELTVAMPVTVAPSSRTPAEATVEHRYEERVLQLPVTADVTAGGDAIDPSEAAGDPATFTYLAPPTAGDATLTFEVRSKRGADQKVVAVKVEAGVIDVTLTGTISYSMPGEVQIGGTVTIGTLHMRQYDGDDADLVGKWVGEGGVEIALSANIPGCGVATGTQTGGSVTIVGTPTDLDGQPALSLFSEEMQGGTASMSCGAGSAMVDGGGISIGAGLVNLGEVVVPLTPGTYPFAKSGVAAGVQFEVAGEALVEETADFPG